MMITSKTDKHVNFSSIIPGYHLSNAITYVIDYCQKHNVTASLEFNGTQNDLDKFSDKKLYEKYWFNTADISKLKAQMRDEKINKILDGTNRNS